MLNKPKFMKPSTNKEECTIDIDVEGAIPFSCIVDGNEAVTKWQIKIYDITNNEEVLDTGEIPLSPSFYPVDEKNRNVVFSVDIKEYLKDDGKFVNREEAYYWTITFWGTSDTTATSYQEVFYANKTPSVGISYKYTPDENYTQLSNKKEDNVLTNRACTFKAELDFGENKDEYKVQLKRYGWRITDTDSGQVFIDTITKNQIYGSADNIICNYNGFLDGGNYSVELFVETQNNAKITPPPLNFSVSYISTSLTNNFKVETLKNEPAIMLNWDEAILVSGVLKDNKDAIVSIDDTIFKTNYPANDQCSIKVPNGFKVLYDLDKNSNSNVDENSYIAFSTQLLSDKDTTLFFAEGFDSEGLVVKRMLSYNANSNGGVFTYEVWEKGNYVSKTYTVKNRPSEYVWYNILMSPLELNIYESRVVDCIYPSKNLYPTATAEWEKVGSKDFYPIFGRWIKEEWLYGV